MTGLMIKDELRRLRYVICLSIHTVISNIALLFGTQLFTLSGSTFPTSDNTPGRRAELNASLT